LTKLNVELSESLMEIAKEVFDFPEKIDRELVVQEEKHAVERQRIEGKVREKLVNFNQRVKAYVEELAEFEEFTEYQRHRDYIVKIEEFEETLVEESHILEMIAEEECKVFGQASSFDKFVNLQRDFEPYSRLWKALGHFLDKKKKWLNGPISQVEPAEVELVLKEHSKNPNRLLGSFAPSSIAHGIAQKFKEDVEQMISYLPAIQVLLLYDSLNYEGRNERGHAAAALKSREGHLADPALQLQREFAPRAAREGAAREARDRGGDLRARDEGVLAGISD